MTWVARFLIIAVAFGGVGSTDRAGRDDVPQRRNIVATAALRPDPMTEAQAGIVAEAVGLFEEAGYVLSERLAVSFHPSVEGCKGNLGLFTIERGVPEARVCWTHEDPGVQRRIQLQGLVHELAHVWAHETLTDPLRDAFVEFVGAASWNDAGTEWGDRGTELAAELITWALLDPPVLFADTDRLACGRWEAAYQLLTAMPAPDHICGR